MRVEDITKSGIMNLILLFNDENLAKIVMDFPVTPLIYKVAKYLRTSEEKEVANSMERVY